MLECHELNYYLFGIILFKLLTIIGLVGERIYTCNKNKINIKQTVDKEMDDFTAIDLRRSEKI